VFDGLAGEAAFALRQQEDNAIVIKSQQSGQKMTRSFASNWVLESLHSPRLVGDMGFSCRKPRGLHPIHTHRSRLPAFETLLLVELGTVDQVHLRIGPRRGAFGCLDVKIL
jgi:hypothetical protein